MNNRKTKQLCDAAYPATILQKVLMSGAALAWTFQSLEPRKPPCLIGYPALGTLLQQHRTDSNICSFNKKEIKKQSSFYNEIMIIVKVLGA